MYGMVNQAVESLVRSRFGDDAWETIKRKAGVDVEVFVSNHGYSDDVTYQLVDAASEVLGLPPDDVLHAFGEYWVLVTAREGYGHLMSAGGNTLAEFLTNLPDFHTRVALLFPDLRPPRFAYSDSSPDGLTLHYFSHRPGLAAFVKGLLSGLGKMYDTPISVTQTAVKADGADHDEFAVRWGTAAA
ncbi:MAG TPA: heme NO-binding domain-containing protein [Gemmatimonadales bacterium]